ncbi:MAG: hypothetical protein ACHQQQ_04645 [Bacteroidota bacterium]
MVRKVEKSAISPMICERGSYIEIWGSVYAPFASAGFTGMDFSIVERKGPSYDAYIGAIHEGMKKNYAPMASILLKTIV